jgi:biopolymer transport protein ExbD
LSKSTTFQDLVDMTAMVDIVFFLLIFFLVTSAQLLQSVIAVPTPDPDEETAAPTVMQSETDDEFIVVKIDRDDTVYLDDDVIPSQQELIVRLRDLREGGEDVLGIMVLGNEECSHEAVVKAIDAGAEAGMQRIRLGVDNSLDD